MTSQDLSNSEMKDLERRVNVVVTRLRLEEVDKDTNVP